MQGKGKSIPHNTSEDKVIDLRALIEDSGVELRPAGSGRLRGLCPLHQEKTPSFFVFQDRGRWRCFGCGEHGDEIDFVRRTRGCGYSEALSFLGMERPQATAPVRREIKRKRAERAAAAWRESETARTLGIAIRCCHEALSDITLETLDDHALVLQQLSILEHHHQILIDGSSADKAAVMAEWQGVRLFKRTLLFKKTLTSAHG